VVLTGPIARQVGGIVGLGDQAVDVWSYLKWPFLAAVVTSLVGILYWVAPNVRHHRHIVGAEFNAELERTRAIEGGLRPPDKTPFLPLRNRRP
jgi:hypothetical protein